MKLALTMDWMVDNDLIYAQQLGVTHIMTPVSRWDPQELRGGAHRVKISGLQMAGVETLPASLLAGVRRGCAFRDEELDRMERIVRALGVAGVPVLSLGWGPRHRWSHIEPVARGKALTRTYDRPTFHPSAQGGDWDTLQGTLKALLPIAEASGVRLALKPDEPGATAGLLGTVEGIERMLGLSDSPSLGLDLCLDTLRLNLGDEMVPAVERLAATGRVLLVRIGCPEGDTSGYREAFIDQGGNLMAAAIQALCSAGVDAPIRPSLTPTMSNDSTWGHVSHAFALGYLRSLIQYL